MKFLDKILCRMQFEFHEFRNEERGASELITVVILIGIAVALAVIFKDRITDLLNSMLDTIEGSATSVVS